MRKTPPSTNSSTPTRMVIECTTSRTSSSGEPRCNGGLPSWTVTGWSRFPPAEPSARRRAGRFSYFALDEPGNEVARRGHDAVRAPEEEVVRAVHDLDRRRIPLDCRGADVLGRA